MGWPGASLPNGDIAGAALVLGMRQNLDLYANVRPCKLYPGVLHRIGKSYQSVWPPELVDMVIIRENTEGLYTPARGRLRRAEETEVAIDTRVITRKGAERVIRYAFDLATRRPRGAPEDGVKRVTCVDKSNVLEGCRFFRETFDRVAKDYPTIEKDYALVDAFTQWLVRNPEHYNVVVSTNMMGDIITDLASVLQGGMGFAAGGNIGDHHAMFEPVHGSAPKYAGKNQVNPFATFAAVEMLLRWLGERNSDTALLRQADRLGTAVATTIAAGTARTYDQGGHVSTSEAGDRVADAVRAVPGMNLGRGVCLVGGATTKFGVRAATWAELAQEAGEALFRAVPTLTTADVDSLFVGAAEPERFAFQSHVAPFAAEQMGLAPRRVVQRTELACASGQSAIRSAYAAIASGLSDVAVAVGVEKMNLPSMAEANASMACVMDRAWDGAHGATAPPFFAMVAQRHMLEYGTTEEALAAVSEKNHKFANANPNAQFAEKTFDRAKLGRLPLVAPPLRLGDCSSMTDGAAAVVLVAEELAKKYTDHPGPRPRDRAVCRLPQPRERRVADRLGRPRATRRTRRSGPPGSDPRTSISRRSTTASRSPRSSSTRRSGSARRARGASSRSTDGRHRRGPRRSIPAAGSSGAAIRWARPGSPRRSRSPTSSPTASRRPGRCRTREWALVHNLSGSANVHSVMIYQGAS